jgi:hypothetical protein
MATNDTITINWDPHALPITGSSRRGDLKSAFWICLRRLYRRGIARRCADLPALRPFDQTRPGKTCSNSAWASPADPEARLARLKGGRTHLADQAGHGGLI